MRSVSLAIVRRETLFVLFIAMEMSWIISVLNLVDHLLEPTMVTPLAWAAWMYPASFLYIKAERRFNARKIWRVALRTVVGGVALIGTVIGLLGPLPPFANLAEYFLVWPFVAVGCAAVFAILRGWILGRSQIDTKGFVEGFQLGFLVLLLVVFLQAAAPPDQDMFLALVSFLGVGLFGLWLARWLESDISARRLDQAGWPLLACAIIAIVLMAGIGIWMFLDHQGLLIILTPVFWLWDLIVAIVQFLISLLPESEEIVLLTGPQPAPRPQQGVDVMDFFGDWVRPIARFMFYFAFCGMMGAALFRNLNDLIRWLNRRRVVTPGITFERSAFGLMDDLRDILAACIHLIEQLWQRVLKFFGSHKRAAPRGERVVRDTYARLLRWAARLGFPRAPNQTPHDFLPVLQRLLPDADRDLTFVTECYVTVRYGTTRANPELIRGMKDSWSRIRSKRKNRL